MERENICGQIKDVGHYFETRRHELRDLEIVGDVRGRKFMMCIENVADKTTGELLAPEPRSGTGLLMSVRSVA